MAEGDRFALNGTEQAARDRAARICRAHRPADDTPLSRAALLALFRELAPLGYLQSVLRLDGAPPPLSPLAFGALVEGCAPSLPLIGNHSVQRYLHAFADAAQAERFLAPLLRGDSIAGIAITEPQAGGDLQRLATTATRDGAHYRLDGEKSWVTHGLTADIFIVLARAESGFLRLIVPADSPGLHREPLRPSGLRHLTFARLVFDGCAVPTALRLGAEGEGAAGAKSAFPIARALAALQALRLGESAMAEAIDFARNRTVFSRQLAETDLVLAGHADLRARLAAARLLAYRSLAALDGENAAGTASGAKALACEASQAACAWSVETLGAAALFTEHAVQRLSRDAAMMAVVDGTAILNRLVAGRRLNRRGGAAAAGSA